MKKEMCPRYFWCKARGSGCTYEQSSSCGIYIFLDEALNTFKQFLLQRLCEKGGFLYTEKWYNDLLEFLKSTKIFSASDIEKTIKEAENEIVEKFLREQ